MELPSFLWWRSCRRQALHVAIPHRIKTAVHLVMKTTLVVVLPAPNIQHPNALMHPVAIAAEVAVPHTLPAIAVKNAATVLELLGGAAITATLLAPATAMMKKSIPHLANPY